MSIRVLNILAVGLFGEVAQEGVLEAGAERSCTPPSLSRTDYSQRNLSRPCRFRYGFATLNVDRLGIGASSHPAAGLITTATEASIAHLLVQTLRNDGFDRVALVGHSYGSVIALAEAGAYRDVDAVVLTGLDHEVSPGFVTTFNAINSWLAAVNAFYQTVDVFDRESGAHGRRAGPRDLDHRYGHEAHVMSVLYVRQLLVVGLETPPLIRPDGYLAAHGVSTDPRAVLADLASNLPNADAEPKSR